MESDSQGRTSVAGEARTKIKVAVTLRGTNAKGHVLRPASLGEVEKKSKRRFFDLGLLVGMR